MHAAVLLGLATMGCRDEPPAEKPADSGGDTRDTGLRSTGWEDCDDRRSMAAPAFCTVWHEDGVEVRARGGPGAYWFGMAETADCVDCWTGEDCIYGYDTGDTTLQWCHDAGNTGTTLRYGGDRQHLAPGQTAFPGPEMEGRVTYFIESLPEFGGDGSCYLWGHDREYYDGLGCSDTP